MEHQAQLQEWCWSWAEIQLPVSNRMMGPSRRRLRASSHRGRPGACLSPGRRWFRRAGSPRRRQLAYIKDSGGIGKTLERLRDRLRPIAGDGCSASQPVWKAFDELLEAAAGGSSRKGGEGVYDRPDRVMVRSRRQGRVSVRRASLDER